MIAMFAIIIGVALIVWILPGIIASVRKHKYTGVIWCLVIVSFFLVETGIGTALWIVALIWSVWPEKE